MTGLAGVGPREISLLLLSRIATAGPGRGRLFYPARRGLLRCPGVCHGGRRIRILRGYNQARAGERRQDHNY